MDADLRETLYVALWTVWAAFAIDFVVRLFLVERERGRYALSHWYDVALIVLPMLRPLRLLHGRRDHRLSGGVDGGAGRAGAERTRGLSRLALWA